MIGNSLSHQPPSTTHKDIADGLEKAFLTEMLKYAGPKPIEGSFGGGIGEDQFSSMLTETYAQALAERIDLGFAGKLSQ